MQYIEIKDSIVEQIGSGVLKAGQKLPSERQLSESFGTTRVTLREALSILEANGMIFREDRRGWFIASPRVCVPVNQFRELSEFIPDSLSYQCELVSADTTMASKAINDIMALPPFSKIHSVDLIHKINDRPVGFVTYWIAEAVCTDLIRQLETRCDLLNIMSPVLDLLEHSKQISVMVKGLEGEIAVKLRATAGTPCLFERRILYQEEQVAFVETTYWRHDSVQLI
ncbi:GntR family transcriptional regulator [Vibrio salinus]|uniref:GntR family transcriptional regulator n=1 Tax=Vibrio salinus TaxID=2899784 RepID=UPI001E4A2927|nr:GntR family transcriptional regulator [Vibrio salinus]MCE0495602.1 GntR family transcriptional regulator [Vibrio salinus]